MATRGPVLALVGLLVLTVAACSGSYEAATNVTSTAATLDASGYCDNVCSWYFQYGTGGQYEHQTTMQSVGAGEQQGSANVSSLTPGTTYNVQLCGKEQGWADYDCVGPDDTPTSSAVFTTPFWSEPLDGQFSNSFFGHVEPTIPDPLTWVSGPTGEAAELTDCGVSRPGVCNDGQSTGSSSDYGQLSAMDGSCQYAEAGGSPGCSSSSGEGHEQDSWYRFKVRFASGYQATPGTQNTVFEFHVDDTTQAEAQAHGYFDYSTLIGVDADGDPDTQCVNASPPPQYYCTHPGTNPRLFIQVPGGSDLSNNQNAYFPFEQSPLQLNHWYDIVLHVYWSADPSKGHAQLWVDGTKYLDVMTPTLYRRIDGTLSYGEAIGFYNYRYWASFPSSIDFANLTVGPTADSVEFNGS